MQHQTVIKNTYLILQTVILYVFMIHLLGCIFIAIGLIPHQNSWIKRTESISYNVKTKLNVSMQHGIFSGATKFYITSVYFITTTITTVGYGDISGVNIYEKLFIIILQFIGILLFTLVKETVLNIKFDPIRKKFKLQAEE